MATVAGDTPARRGHASWWRHLREPVARDVLAACEPYLAGRPHVLEHGLQTLDAARATANARVQPERHELWPVRAFAPEPVEAVDDVVGEIARPHESERIEEAHIVR